ncbi:Uncharacterized protein TCM_032665 [Theobroma cacao]|uniref:Uncharacterized protein n=1 Tax=Theobroma cacao TaxID=3641 RepID=A0A061FA44_THECC|nr:Uncharacterized protein TCM_032665 [Theobroma cacao]
MLVKTYTKLILVSQLFALIRSTSFIAMTTPLVMYEQNHQDGTNVEVACHLIANMTFQRDLLSRKGSFIM